jgi:mRNA-degrading endonuclease RelE of RelBE toxin-antitoxin system
MTNRPFVEVIVAPHFERKFRRLQTKYRHIAEDIQPLTEQLSRGETPGDQIQGVGYTVYKARVRNSDAKRGKSGGYRVIYYVKTAHRIFLATIYSKSDQKDIPLEEIRRIIQEILAEDEPQEE